MKIFCVGRNYAEHALELNNAVPAEPVIFMKPSTALLPESKDFYYPNFTKDLHYECELVIRICKNGKAIQEKFAHTYYDAITVGIDFTARDIQQLQKEKGLPWEIAKAFDNSAVVGNFTSVNSFDTKQPFEFNLEKNGMKVQQGNSNDMLFSFEKIIAYVSQFFTLNMSDYIFTGTPSGVGPVLIGDELKGYLMSDEKFKLKIK